MDIWQKARTLAEEEARRSKELTKEAAKRSLELTACSSRFSVIVSEASKRSKEIAAEASKPADQIRVEAAKRADLIKFHREHRAFRCALALAETTAGQQEQEEDLERYGVTEELREFVKEITMSTFRDFSLQDDSEMSDIPTKSNIRKDLNECYEKHYMEDAKLKPSEQVKDDGVKEPSKNGIIPKLGAKESNQHSKTSTSSSAEEDSDEFPRWRQ